MIPVLYRSTKYGDEMREQVRLGMSLIFIWIGVLMYENGAAPRKNLDVMFLNN